MSEVEKCPKCAAEIETKLNEPEEMARNTLLDHYSSRTANAGIMVLTIVLVFLTFLQVFPVMEWRWLYLLFLGPLILYMVVREFQRILT